MTLKEQLTDRALVQSLNGRLCPACGLSKGRGKTFCSNHYFRLPRAMRMALYARLGAGYAEAVAEAMVFFEAETFRVPEHL